MQNLFDIAGIEPDTLNATKVMESVEDNRLKKSLDSTKHFRKKMGKEKFEHEVRKLLKWSENKG
tara:strand:+ start:369 stop:560 length:192 start_codon:yes stop_codon:yes gene_type:complete